VDKVHLNPTSPTSFKFPVNRLLTLRDRSPRPPTLDADNGPCLILFRNGAKTSTTVGKASKVSSYTRNYFAGQYQESREWPVIPTNKRSGTVIPIDKHSGAFSANGDSGSCVADAFQRIGDILTGGSGGTKSSDMTYFTPITFIVKVLHGSKRFQYAHLNPDLV